MTEAAARPAYGEDLAFIHDQGFGDFARRSVPGLLGILRRAGVENGLIVDLGCGSGIWARALLDAGYDVLGVDLSEAMIDLARRRAPGARFRVGSLHEADLPPCAAVTSLGECVAYEPGSHSRHGRAADLGSAGSASELAASELTASELTASELTASERADRGSSGRRRLRRLFQRIHEALLPGGVLVFDLLEPGVVRGGAPERRFTEGEGWLVAVEVTEEGDLLTRRITTFRRADDSPAGADGRHVPWRRSDEIHRQRLHDPTVVEAGLRELGFRVRRLRGYGRLRFRRGHVGFVARRPR